MKHTSMGYCTVSISPMRSNPKDTAEMVSQLLFGETVTILDKKDDNWLHVQSEMDAYKGWVDTKHITSISEQDAINWQKNFRCESSLLRTLETPWGEQKIFRGSFVPKNKERKFQIGEASFSLKDTPTKIETNNAFIVAHSYLNAPYLWGGKTPFGIDCSGLTQYALRFLGVELPRDASQQVKHGKTIDFASIQTGDLAFFENEKGKITHVGIIHEDYSIIHASGHVRIDQLTEKGILHSSDNRITHKLTCIQRMIH